jgi:flagellar M-ring protein FliF
MPTQFSLVARRLSRSVSGFTTGQKVLSGLVLAGLLLGGFAFSRWASAPSYSPLFSNLAASDASAIVDKLNSAGVKYELADGGQTVMVPQQDVYAERLKMSSAGLPAAKDTGYSLLDQQGVTASQFQQQVAYQRAMEGELDNTIEAIDGVQTAIVHLAIPQQDVFLSDAQKPSASVLVNTGAGVQLGQGQVQSIVHLVSSSIEGMDATQVTVVDGQGNLLSAAGDSTGATTADLAGSQRTSQTDQYEADVETSLQAMLDKVLGPGHAVAKVTAQLDLDNTNTTTETMVAPNPTAPPLSYSKSSETYANANGTSSTGVLGPDNIAVPTGSATAGTGSGNNYVKASETADNPYGKITEQRKSTPGKVVKQSVSIVVDSAVKNVNLSGLQQSLSAAAGVDTTRGDTIAVTSMAFDTTAAATAKKQLAAAASAKSRDQFFGMIKTAAVALLVLLVLGLAFLMSRKRPTTERELLELEMFENAQRMPLAIGAGAGGIASGGMSALPAGPDLGSANPELTERRQAVHALVERQPDEVAELLRGWLADRRG